MIYWHNTLFNDLVIQFTSLWEGTVFNFKLNFIRRESTGAFLILCDVPTGEGAGGDLTFENMGEGGSKMKTKIRFKILHHILC